MPEELFDIVGENNQPTDEQKPRSVVHGEMTDWHRTTHIWIVNDKNEILCQQRSLAKDANPGKWQSFFGGHLKAGQTYEKNAVEEIREELCINAAPKDLIPLYVRKSESAKHFGQVYLLRWNGKVEDLSFDDGEVEQIAWFDIARLRKAIAEEQFCNSLDEKVIEYLEGNKK